MKYIAVLCLLVGCGTAPKTKPDDTQAESSTPEMNVDELRGQNLQLRQQVTYQNEQINALNRQIQELRSEASSLKGQLNQCL